MTEPGRISDDLLWRYLDGDLSDTEAAALEAAVAADPFLERRLAWQVGVLSRCREAAHASAPVGLSQRIQTVVTAEVRGARPNTAPSGRLGPLPPARMWRPLLGAAAACFLLVFAGLRYLPPPTTQSHDHPHEADPRPALVAQVAAMPGEWGMGKARFVADQLGLTVFTADLPDSGANHVTALVDAHRSACADTKCLKPISQPEDMTRQPALWDMRAVHPRMQPCPKWALKAFRTCFVVECTTVQYMGQSEGHPVSYFVVDGEFDCSATAKTEIDGVKFHTWEADGVRVVGWRHEGAFHALVSDLPTEQLIALMQLNDRQSV